MIFLYIIHFEHIWLKSAFDFETYENFETVTITKVVHIYVIENMNA